jgi:hypothetical protein
MTADDKWADLARASRAALALLGHQIGPLCLPDEPDACGIGYELHALAHLATLAAITDHHLQHLGGVDTPMVQDIYLHAAAETRERCQLDTP